MPGPRPPPSTPPTTPQYRDRIVFLQKPVDDELGNQLVATLLYLDSESDKDIKLYINCTGGEARGGGAGGGGGWDGTGWAGLAARAVPSARLPPALLCPCRWCRA